MKLVELQLRAFGHFTDVKLDLGAGREGLHIIVGDNETGKSTALDAIRNLLYGIDPRSRYDFVHKYSQMRIGATLKNGDGSLIRCVRRKGNRDTLRDADDLAVLDESVLATLLGGVDARLFSTLFGLNHTALTEGGREILEGDGDLGQLIFAAGSGLTRLRSALDSLEGEARELYTERGQNPVINRGLRELRDCEQAVRERAVPGETWRSTTAELEATERRLRELAATLDEKTRESNRLGRIADALPLSVRHQELVRELEEVDGVVELADDFVERRVETARTIEQNEEKERQLEESLRRLDEEVLGIEILPAVLEHAETIESLRDLLTRQRDLEQSLPGRRTRAEHLDERAAVIRRSLGLAGEEEALLTVAERAEIRALSRGYERLRERVEDTRVQTEESRRDELRDRHARLPPPRDPGRLKARVKAARELMGLEGRARDLRAEAGAAMERAALLLGHLPEWEGSMERFEALAVPEADAVRQSEQSLASLRERIDGLRDRSRELGREIAELEGEEAELAGGASPPAEKTLRDARRLRDRGWKIVRESLEGEKVDRRRIQRFTRDLAPERELSGAFELAMRRADELADRLREESDRIAGLRSLREALAARRRELDAASGDLEEARRRQRAEEQRWEDLWALTGMAPRSPAAVRAWLERRGEILELRAIERRARSGLETLEGEIEAARAELEEELEVLGAAPAPQGLSLAALLSLCEDTVERVEEAERERRQLLEAVAEAERVVEDSRREEREAAEEWESWRGRWAASLEPLGLGPEANPEQVEEVLTQVDALRDLQAELRELRREIADSGESQRRFDAAVESLSASIGTEISASGSVARVEEFARLLEQVRRDEHRLELLEEQRREKREELEACRSALATARAESRALCEEAGREKPSELADAERASARRRELREEFGRIREGLSKLSAGDSIEAFLSQVRNEDADRLPRGREALARELEELKATEAELLERRGGLRESLDHLRESAEAARAASASEEAASLRAALGPSVDRYVQLRLASEILRRTIDRYRRKNQGPIVERASACFARLTGGSFAGLEQDLDENGRPILQGYRPEPDGARILVKHMSEGTRDQLFLALRLASIERYLDSHPAVPFILDDILINFDDPRSSATLGCLAEISRRTQVIFFTHHRHLVALARRAVPEDTLFVHELQESGCQVHQPSPRTEN